MEQQLLHDRWTQRYFFFSISTPNPFISWIYEFVLSLSYYGCSYTVQSLYVSVSVAFLIVLDWLFFLAGPILLEDYHLVEKLANFDRERIPERVVHARGASAKGFFEVTHDISNLTCADFLRAPGVQTPVIVRFSTVIHERGSPETLRDPRGFAVKFYTREVS